MCRRTEQTFFQRGNADGQQAHEKMLNITNHQGYENQNHNEIPPYTRDTTLHLSEWLSLKRTQITNVGKDVEKREHLYTVGGNVNWYSRCGKHCGGFSKN